MDSTRTEFMHHGLRVVLLPTITALRPGDAGAVVVAGSHGGANVAAYVVPVSVCLVVFNDAGVGRNRAGIAALGLLDGQGVPAVAVSHDTGMIGDPADMWTNGLIAHANAAAMALGVRVSESVQQAVARLGAR